ncbi:MAG: hypothetical protein DBY41_06440 [Clostridium sp.]|nr:MAG: hypothetical protein DBY41_06440 [Clostridium sp.]
MRVLFAVNNEKISEAITKKYQSMYKEIISGKNVYFFNAIIKELQKDKSYDRIVIGEDLEPYANNNYEVIDNFLYDKLDSISDEASNSREGDIPIILIATDRRERRDSLLAKLFSMGIYNVLIGQDRRIDNVCKLINMPRTKKEAKVYYGIDGEEVEYTDSNMDTVKEEEIQHILNHYKKLGKNEDLYVKSFEEIAEQYTDTQLKLITKYLPLNVRAVLEERCPKYQQVMIGSVKNQVTKGRTGKKITTKNIESKNVNKIELIDKELQKAKLTKPVVIPSAINMQNVKKAYTTKQDTTQEVLNSTNSTMHDIEQNNVMPRIEQSDDAFSSLFDEEPEDVQPNIQNNPVPKYIEPKPIEQEYVQPITLQQGDNNLNLQQFGKETNTMPENEESNQTEPVQPVKKGRGRPRKEKTPEEIAMEEAKVKKGRGRPKKIVEPEEKVENEAVTLPEPEEDDDINLFDLNNQVSSNVQEQNSDDVMLPGFEDETPAPKFEQPVENKPVDFFKRDFNNDLFENNEMPQLPGMESFNNNKIVEPQEENKPEEKNEYEENGGYLGGDLRQNNTQNLNNSEMNNYSNSFEYFNKNNQIQGSNAINTVANNTQNENTATSNLVTSDCKIVSFVGTSKNGTSFLVNNLAVLLSNKGIKTAILDLTKNKNAYYIYTLNEDALREKSFRCIDGLRSGVADGIQVSKNLTVYTTLPGENPSIDDYENILDTLSKNYSLVLLDCDFDTNFNYFAESHEIYLVQTYDILTIQPLTAFLNELKYKNILNPNKLRIVINKTLKLRKLTDKMVIGGISCYNDPASTYINTLFDKDNVKYTTIPFEDQTYGRYLERLVDCEISLNGYSKIFLDALQRLGDMVYPLIANEKNKTKPTKNYNDYSKKNTKTNYSFNSNMNATLNKMRNNF